MLSGVTASPTTTSNFAFKLDIFYININNSLYNNIQIVYSIKLYQPQKSGTVGLYD